MKNQSILTDFSYIILVIADKNNRSEEKMANLGTDFLVKCTNINKFYRKQHVLKNVSLTVQKRRTDWGCWTERNGENNFMWNFSPIASCFEW
ncbi:hypothetical protein [Spiroplasma citri]|uniref:hypothetical protein n=1 Tax=Spiroplasma citri TaxID=2133 RepID=UPI0020A498DB|nr:hypothetical protein [Spiroplasma citri]